MEKENDQKTMDRASILKARNVASMSLPSKATALSNHNQKRLSTFKNLCD